MTCSDSITTALLAAGFIVAGVLTLWFRRPISRANTRYGEWADSILPDKLRAPEGFHEEWGRKSTVFLGVVLIGFAGLAGFSTIVDWGC